MNNKVDVCINVYGKPWQTLCTLKSLMKHSGDIGFYNNQSAGVTFVIGLPRTEESPPYIFDAAAVKQLIGLV